MERTRIDPHTMDAVTGLAFDRFFHSVWGAMVGRIPYNESQIHEVDGRWHGKTLPLARDLMAYGLDEQNSR